MPTKFTLLIHILKAFQTPHVSKKETQRNANSGLHCVSIFKDLYILPENDRRSRQPAPISSTTQELLNIQFNRMRNTVANLKSKAKTQRRSLILWLNRPHLLSSFRLHLKIEYEDNILGNWSRKRAITLFKV